MWSALFEFLIVVGFIAAGVAIRVIWTVACIVFALIFGSSDKREWARGRKQFFAAQKRGHWGR